MIEFQNISKRYGAQEVLTDVSFRINPGERVGIVGPNGAGKSTLFGLITNDLSPDHGDVILPRDVRLGYLRQQLGEFDEGQSLLEYTEHAMPMLKEIQREMESIEHRLHQPDEPDRPADLRRLGELQTKFEHIGGYEIRNRAEAALCGLGFSAESLSAPFSSFSGGWQMRAELARTLVAQPDTLLLDEPSNYLDLPAVEWLQRYLKAFSGTLMLISHDRYLLNTLTSRTIEINGARATSYSGNYTYYAEQRVLREEQRLAEQKNQDRKREQVERFIERFRAKNTKAAQVQSRIKMLEKMEDVQVPIRIVRRGRIRLAAPPHCGNEVLRLEDAGLTYDGARWVLRNVNLSVSRGEKIALAGLNGLGKTTLLRMMAGQIPLSEGARVLGHKVVVGYQAQESSETMRPDDTVLVAVRQMAPHVPERDVRTLLGSFGFSGEAVDKKVAVLSGGEKIRLAFARLLIEPPNFLLLDEPTTHLDIDAREALEDALSGYEGTLCFVSHDVEFVRHVATSIIAMTPPGVTRYAGGYDYYREKIAQAAQPVSQVAAKTDGIDRKAEKRERAMKTQADSKARRILEKTIKQAEERIATLETEQAALLEKISSPDGKTDFAGINQRLAQIQQEMNLNTEAWEKASLELEELIQARQGTAE
ncbi:MAG TPA: hypothetical protein DCZ95_14875 [Verrucomicrobia bacterium]|nr:MAG: hypothetical protein A2X46_18020 [Lentisphaerae bacterium GWF2_57_35]HBA85368.1 hypothetical protein [Verrucomicrobiota bacterium]